ncbi:MAG: hypothetical protein GX995_03255 [Clostridiales bacterium]|nr:hypothetical protein [Clostridiales bacterium]
MGKLILCKGAYAKRPYYMSIGDVNIYSIEELNFYIANNLDIIVELDLSKSLIDWIRDQLEMGDLADKLYKLQGDHVSSRLIIQAILNSCNYFTSSEKAKIIQTVSELENLPLVQRRIKKANTFLLARNYLEAEVCYESLINGEMAVELSAEEYGQILHNLGIAKIYTVGLNEASVFFKHAYEVNKKEESLKQYLIALKLSNREDLLNEQVKSYDLPDDFLSSILNDYNTYLKNYEDSDQYKQVKRLMKLHDEDSQAFIEEALYISKDIEKQYRRCTNEYI